MPKKTTITKKPKQPNEAALLWRNLFETFPPLDPASEFYDTGVSGADVVNWLGENAKDIRRVINAEEKRIKP